MKYFNQRTITVNRDKVNSNSGKLFLCIYQDNLSDAMKNLGKSALEAFLCLAFNKDGYTIDYSPALISKITGMCLDTARSALRELENKGYLIKDDAGNYSFYEKPQLHRRIYIEKREFIDDETGEIYNLSYSELVKEVGEFQAKYLWEDAKK